VLVTPSLTEWDSVFSTGIVSRGLPVEVKYNVHTIRVLYYVKYINWSTASICNKFLIILFWNNLKGAYIPPVQCLRIL